MRVTYLHQYFVTPDMPGGSRSYEMARRLVAMGHEVNLITSDQRASDASGDWKETTEAGIRVHWTPLAYDNSMSYPRRIRSFFAFAWRAARRAAAIDADVIFATSTPLTIAIPAVYAARRRKVPMVFEVRDLWPAVPIAIGAIRNPLLVKAAQWLETFAYRNSAHVVALAPGMGQEVVATGYPEDQVSIIPNGCDLSLFSNEMPDEDVRRQHEWLGNRPLIVFAGTFGKVNGMPYMVHLAKSCSELDDQICFVAIGAGAEFEGTQQLAKEVGVLDTNLVLLGAMPKTQVARWVRAADFTLGLFTGPEIVWRDAVQNKFFDSLAAGTPVANNFPGWQSLLSEEAGAGLILDPADTAESAKKLVSALRDERWLAKASVAARELGRSRFDRDALAADLERVLLQASEAR